MDGCTWLMESNVHPSSRISEEPTGHGAVGCAQHPFFSYLHPTPSRHPPTTPPFLTPTPHPVTTPNRKQLYRPDADRLDPAELVVSGEAQVEAHKVHLYAVVRGDGMVLWVVVGRRARVEYGDG